MRCALNARIKPAQSPACLTRVHTAQYGVTSIPLQPYMAASLLASLPRTWATVSAGTMGASLLEGEGTGGAALGAGFLFAIAATAYISRVANEALEELEAEEEAAGEADEPRQQNAGQRR